jgi:hypothetical protein
MSRSVKNDFQWRQYQGQLILLCVRWYLAFTLSYRQLERIVVLVNSDVIDNLGFGVLPSVPFRPLFSVLFASLSASFRSRAALQLEILALRHQVVVLQRSVKRPKLTPPDRFLWAGLCAVWKDWRSMSSSSNRPR